MLADLQVLDTHHSRAQLDSLQAELEQSRASAGRFDKEQKAAERKIEEHENQVATQRGKLEEVDARINEGRAEVQRLQNQIASHHNRIEFNRERAQELTTLIERYELDVETAEAKRAQQETEIHDTDVLLSETERLLEAKRTELAELTKRAAEVRREREEYERELQALELAISKAENRLADLETDIVGTTKRRTATEPRLRELEASLGEAAAAAALVASKLSGTRTTAEEHNAALQDLAAQIPAAEEVLGRQQQLLREAEAALIASDRALAERQSRLEILRQLNAEGAGLTEGSQAVLRGLDDPVRILPALTGALASLIEVDGEFVPAVEAALGRNLHAIVLQNNALAGEIIATVTARKLGHTALVAPELTSGVPAVAQKLPPGALGWATEKIHASADLEPLVRHLLGDVALVADLEQAQQLKKKFPAIAFATLNGDLVSSKGVIYGGRVNEETSSVFARKAQIAALAADHHAVLEDQQNLRRKHEDIQRQLEAATDDLQDIREQHQAARGDHSSIALQVTALDRELHEAKRKVDAFEWERTTLDQQMNSSAERIAQLERDSAAQRSFLEEARERQEALQSTVETARLRDEQVSRQLSELHLAVATERQRHEGLRSQRQPMTTRQKELAELITSRRADIANYQSRREQQSIETAAAERSIEENSAELFRAESAVAEVAATRAAHLTEVNTLESDLRGWRKALSELHEARGKEEVRQTQIQLKIENLAEHVMRRYQIDLHEFAPDRYAFSKTFRAQIKQRGKAEIETAPADATAFDETQLREIIEQLTRQLDAMGPVNLDAVHEYDELEERHTFLETQNADLTNSRRELLDVITRINQTTEKLFAETFAQVRINFREMFGELFGGGRADLVLLDESDALNCGIDIIAKPPGKQLQSVSLLSGGERAMTAVALLFAIYMVRPSPFCVLDEMDAPLDESNINRFIRMLDRFVAQSQFIIITHNKRTIAKADILYGVTMEERGISKLVGMRLTEAKPEDERLPAREPTLAQQQPLELDDAPPENVALTR